MAPSLHALHSHTPTLQVIDPRGLVSRAVLWHRSAVDQPAQPRVERATFDLMARLVERRDARLFADAHASGNLCVVYSLSGQVLRCDSVDAGVQVSLPGEGGQLLERWDGRGTHSRREFDPLLRPIAVFERGAVGAETCLERLEYGAPDLAASNQSGRLIRHDDPAGTLINSAFGLTGALIEQTRHFLAELSVPDWPPATEQRDKLLESGDGAITTWRHGPRGDVLQQTDAMGNRQSFVQTVAGQLRGVSVQLKDQPRQALFSDIGYDAHNRIESETLGNGVTTTAQFDPAHGRLLQLRARGATGSFLQDLNYDYDPVGNVVSIEDHAQPTRFFANQQVEPLREFGYDTLYQLIEATGYEGALVRRGPADKTVATANELANYTQRYEYDAGGNLLKLTHAGAQNHTRLFAIARFSNRSLLQTSDQPPSEEQIAAAFDENGNVHALQPGRTLSWDLRNQLCEVHPVERESGDDDREMYRYDAGGQRVRKIRISQARAVVHSNEVRYLPGLEIRSNTATGEVLNVMTTAAGRSDVRILHWQRGLPSDLENDQIRYSLTDHLGSSTLELDMDAQLISQEVYYPYGETAWFAARSEVEAKYKTIRYSGKERDATGLYYYGLRYYAPWLMRWINPDPLVSADLNRYSFVENRPLYFIDFQGLAPQPSEVVAIGISAFPSPLQEKMREVVQLSKEMLRSTIEQLSSTETNAALEQSLTISFGSERVPDFAGKLKEHLEGARQFIVSLEGAREAQLHLANLLRGIRGATSDAKISDRTVTMSEAFLKSGHPMDVAKTLIHEATHAVSDTRDYAYIGLGTKTPSGSRRSMDRHVKTLQDSSAELLKMGPNESKMGVWDKVHYRKLMKAYGVAPGDVAGRQEVFKSNSQARDETLLRNADSLATFVVIAHHHTHAEKSRPSRFQFMRNLLN